MNDNNKIITLTFPLPQVDVLALGLRKLPIEIGIDTLNSLVQQANEQLTPKPVEEEPVDAS